MYSVQDPVCIMHWRNQLFQHLFYNAQNALRYMSTALEVRIKVKLCNHTGVSGVVIGLTTLIESVVATGVFEANECPLFQETPNN